MSLAPTPTPDVFPVLEGGRAASSAAALTTVDGLRALFDHLPTAVYFTDVTLRIRYVNAAAWATLTRYEREVQDHFGVRLDQVIGARLHRLSGDEGQLDELVSDPTNLPYDTEYTLGEITLSASLNAVRDAAGEIIGYVAAWRDISCERKKYLEQREQLTHVFTAVDQTASLLLVASQQLEANAQTLREKSNGSAEQAARVSQAANEVSHNINTVASGTEEMGVSIREISQNAAEAARVASEAVNTAREANETVRRLGVSSTEIGKVLKVITSIAQQTNLLALNATIEAARAGDAGKGFAVVANEVKELAKQSAASADDISRRVEAIRADTQGAVQAIGDISTVIRRINDIQGTIAGAVEEQTATTSEMARNIAEAARGGEDIARGVSRVAQSSTEGLLVARALNAAAEEVNRMASELQSSVQAYRG